MLVAVRLNPCLHSYYWCRRRVRERPTVAMIACMQCINKLLAAVYIVAKTVGRSKRSSRQRGRGF
jgi:hypothetical protein